MSKLSSGIFWVISENIELLNHQLVAFKISCDTDGNVIETPVITLNAKSEKTYNHKKLWESEVQNNSAHKAYNKKPFDYFPRGRVEVSNNRATIYLNPHINVVEIINEIKEKFGLTESNISSVRVVADGTGHYRCFIDREVKAKRYALEKT